MTVFRALLAVHCAIAIAFKLNDQGSCAGQVLDPPPLLRTAGPPSAAALAAFAMIKHSAATPADTLAVAILFSHYRGDLECLKCLTKAISLVSQNVAPYTPTRIYVYTLHHHADMLRSDLGPASAFGLSDGQIQVESIPKEQWSIPVLAESSGNASLWEVLRVDQGLDYRMMGEWYLQHMAPAVKAFGHRYVLKMDSDSFVHEPIDGSSKGNIVALFRSARLLMGARRIIKDKPALLWGAPEAARLFLSLERLNPPGPIFQHCKPANLDGLFSNYYTDATHGSIAPVPSYKGYDNTIIHGNFVILDLDWYLSPLVQRWVHLARASGGTLRYRWNEQSTWSLMWLMLVPEQQFRQFRFKYQHKRAWFYF